MSCETLYTQVRAFLIQLIEFATGGESTHVLATYQDNESKQDAPELNLDCLRQGSGYIANEIWGV